MPDPTTDPLPPRRVSRLMAVAQLVRFSAFPTAIGAPWVGYVLMAGAAPDPVMALLLAGVAVGAYLAGMATNDLFDVDKDRKLRNEHGRTVLRPVADGALSAGAGWAIALALQVGSLVCAYLVSVATVIAAAALIAATYLYNGWLKKWRVRGSIAMGMCRGLNVIVGAAAAWTVMCEPASAAVLRTAIAAFLFGYFTCQFTLLSTYEEGPADPTALESIAREVRTSLFVIVPIVIASSHTPGISGASGVTFAALAACAAWWVWRSSVIVRGVRPLTREPSGEARAPIPLGPKVGFLIGQIPMLEVGLLLLGCAIALPTDAPPIVLLAAIIFAGTFLTKWLRKRISFT